MARRDGERECCSHFIPLVFRERVRLFFVELTRIRLDRRASECDERVDTDSMKLGSEVHRTTASQERRWLVFIIDGQDRNR